uniref:Spondin domain-containing protein n=1 Tax=Eptatretus burgeri TaxID=7764 RepID=A0A8C4PWX6_EPTBU
MGKSDFFCRMTGRCPLSVMAVVMLLFAACMTSPQRPQQSPRRRHSGAYSASRWANRKCQVRERAKYLLTFTGLWSQTAFPKQYPKFRPPAQWSGLIAIAHGRKYRMWRLGRLASTGVREMAEQGEAWGLMRELEASIINGRPTISGLFTTPGIANGTGQTFIELEVNSQHPLVSVILTRYMLSLP